MSAYDSMEAAVALAARALREMAAAGVPPVPENFVVWFHYLSGDDPELLQAMDGKRASREPLTEADNLEIHDRFFGPSVDSAAIAVTSGRIVNELRLVLDHLTGAGEETSQFSNSLETFSGLLEVADGGEKLAPAIEAILMATENMLERNRKLEARLSESSGTISRLRQDLDDMRRQALTDPLTGIANRKMFDAQLRKAISATGARRKLSLLMLDVDHFKAFNDAHGHQAGDNVLVILADIMTQTIKDQDTAARYGGEEFSVILPGTDLEGAVRVADAIRQRISARDLVNRQTGQSFGTVTVSIGVAELVKGEPLSAFVSRADQALYEAKSKGRNRVSASV